MAYSYENELRAMKDAQKQAAIGDLQRTRDEKLSDLTAESQKAQGNAETQRNTANVQNRLAAKNFQEYLASTGRANSGLSAQASLQNRNNLNTSLNNITSNLNTTLADIERQRTNANNAYNTGLSSANAQIEADYISNLLDQRQKAAQMAQQEKEFNESVRQFNEQMALERQKMYSNFSSGGSGGSGRRRRGRRYGRGTSTSEPDFVDSTENQSNVQGLAAALAKGAASLGKAVSKTTKSTKKKTTSKNKKTNLSVTYNSK